MRTWIEIDTRALGHNMEEFLRVIPAETGMMAVVKSNAYGHDLTLVAKHLSGYWSKIKKSKPLWFGVDSITEGLRLRREGIKNPILILGYTLPTLLSEARINDLVVSMADFVSLEALSCLGEKPLFFLKIDSGLHRRGFVLEEARKLSGFMNKRGLKPIGVFSHFASASSPAHKNYSAKQIEIFQKFSGSLFSAGFGNLTKSMAATGGAMFYPEAHLDLVRIGMGIYGYPPAFDLKKNKMSLRPALTWKTLVSEVKEIPSGSCVGYGLTHCVRRATRIAILPIGFWHGVDRRFSNRGEVLIRGRRAQVLGSVSMDILVVDATGIDRIKAGDEAVIIGRQGKEAVWADEIAQKINSSHYELLTRINPLIKRFEI